MSYKTYDAWLDEVNTGDWPFERWALPNLDLREDYDYLRRYSFNSPIIYRLRSNFKPNDRGSLIATLNEAKEIVETAIENSEADAYSAWLGHEVWLPVLDDSIRSDTQPAQILIESIDYVGTNEFEPQQVCAAMGIWCYGEYSNALGQDNHMQAIDYLHEAALALAEAEWYRGKKEQELTVRRQLSKRNRIAAEKGHTAHRENKLQGFVIWDSRKWRVQADAEREIASQCNITQAVAGRWIREFKRSPDAYRAAQSKHFAPKRT